VSSRKISDHIEEINKFLELYRAAEPEKGPAKAAMKTAYRRFHAVLIWQMYLDDPAKFDDVTCQYSNEYTADISQALLTALMGFYKPSRMMLRSSIENFTRIACIIDKKEPLSAKTVYALMEIFKKTTLRDNPETNSALLTLVQKYGELCDYVHTTSPMKMDLRIPFSKVVESDSLNAIACFENIGSVCQSINKILFRLCPSLLQSMHHRDADYIRDLIPAAMKQV
jgi:hypothetical protein